MRVYHNWCFSSIQIRELKLARAYLMPVPTRTSAATERSWRTGRVNVAANVDRRRSVSPQRPSKPPKSRYHIFKFRTIDLIHLDLFYYRSERILITKTVFNSNQAFLFFKLPIRFLPIVPFQHVTR